MQKHFEMAAEVVRGRIGLDKNRVGEEFAEIFDVIAAKLFDPDFRARSLPLTKAARALFAEVFDATPGLYVRVRRTEVTLFLLDYTEGKIPAIAKLVGYPTVATFNYSFRKMMGRSPTEERRHWRRHNKGKTLPESQVRIDGRPLRSPRIYDGPITRKALVGALPPHFAAFQLCFLRYRASDDLDELSWLRDQMTNYLTTVEEDPHAVPEIPSFRFKTESLSPDEELALLERAAQPTRSVLDTYEKNVPSNLRSMLAELRANFTTPDYRLDRLRDEVGAYHADRSEFSAYMGVTPWQYLFEGRMETASRLLRDTPLSVPVIAQLMGYADAPQFRRAFKNWSGELSPDEYRARVRYVALQVGPAPARFTNWRYLEHIRGPAPKEGLELVQYVERVYSFVDRDLSLQLQPGQGPPASPHMPLA